MNPFEGWGRGENKKSLRRSFFTRFFLLTLVPLSVLGFVVQSQYKKTVNQQIKDRLTIHVREIETLFAARRRSIEEFLNFVHQDKSFAYYLNTLNSESLKNTLSEKLNQFGQDRVKVYTYTGKPILVYNKEFKPIEETPPLTPDILEEIGDERSINTVKFWGSENETILVLSHLQKISGVQGRAAGYIEALFPIDTEQVKNISDQIGAELVFFDRQGQILLGSLPKSTDNEQLNSLFLLGHNSFFEFDVQSSPYAFISTSITWGTKQFLIGVGASTQDAALSISKVNYFIIFTYLCFLLFFVLMLYFFLREFVHPIESLVTASEKMKESREVVFIENKSRTEIAYLIDSFNEMSKKTHEAESQLRNQLDLLEKANIKIKKTQSQLVQSAKLASLGELVAGIAHELNNPIGFIYSNIGHLKSYSKSLMEIVDGASSNKAQIEELKNEKDYDYIVSDFPKLIQSCEEGANRAKEIVLGLRNFSRADDTQAAAFDINEGLESTLNLLGGEIKNRIEVHKKFGEIPEVICNGNQVKQVFMNVISNACQAIEGSGEIHLITDLNHSGDSIVVRIKDSGSGINAQDLDKIFDPFYTTKEIGKGTGLGLSISYGIISSLGGEIDVDSQPGDGTEFTILIPIAT